LVSQQLLQAGAQPHEGSAAQVGSAQAGAAQQVGSAAAHVASQHVGAQQLPWPIMRSSKPNALASEATNSIARAAKE